MAKKSKIHKIAVIAGDGIGPEVTVQAIKVLQATAGLEKAKFNFVDYDLGGERYLRTGEVLPDSVLAELRKMDAIYLGAVGHLEVKTGILEQGLLLKLRFELDQYINLRPVKLYPGVKTPLADKGPEDLDFVVVRENTEGLYAGVGGFLRKGTKDEVATQEMVNTRMGVERVLRYAFKLAKRRKKELVLCDKANVLTYAHDLWRRAFQEVGDADFKGIKRDCQFVDAVCMRMVSNPEWYDVIVTCNMFGDIITDLGAVLQGGLGVAASGNINPEGVSMFEPVHGSAPQYAGQNKANPIAAIGAAQMMAEELGEGKVAARMKKAMAKVLSTGKLKDLPAVDVTPTDVAGDWVCKEL